MKPPIGILYPMVSCFYHQKVASIKTGRPAGWLTYAG